MAKVRLADLVTGIGGAVLLAGTFMTWYRYPDPELQRLLEFNGVAEIDLGSARRVGANAWDLTVIRFVLYFAAIAAIWLLVATALARTTAAPVVLGTPAAIGGWLATAAVAFRWIDAPFAHAQVESGLYVSFGGAVVCALGSVWALRDEFTPPGFARAPEPELIVLDGGPEDGRA